MSHTRKIKVMPIPKPKPFVLDKSLYHSETNIKNREILEQVLKSLGYSQVGRGSIVGKSETMMADIKVSSDLGFIIRAGDGLELITTGKADLLINKISSVYSYFTCIKNLEKEGYVVKEEKEEGDTFSVLLEKETEEEIKAVEVKARVNNEIKIHSINHEGATECVEVIEKAEESLEIEEVLENEKTYEYAKKRARTKEKEPHKVDRRQRRERKKQRVK